MNFYYFISTILVLFSVEIYGRTLQCGLFCEPTDRNCQGVIVRDVCQCYMCVEHPKQKYEECGDQLGPYGVCDSRQGLICQYPLDDVYATGTCIEDEHPIMIEPISRAQSLWSRLYRYITSR